MGLTLLDWDITFGALPLGPHLTVLNNWDFGTRRTRRLGPHLRLFELWDLTFLDWDSTFMGLTLVDWDITFGTLHNCYMTLGHYPFGTLPIWDIT